MVWSVASLVLFAGVTFRRIDQVFPSGSMCTVPTPCLVYAISSWLKSNVLDAFSSMMKPVGGVKPPWLPRTMRMVYSSALMSRPSRNCFTVVPVGRVCRSANPPPLRLR